MALSPTILAFETSCDETAVAIARGVESILASEVASQIAIHQPFGGVVPELASRNHNLALRPLVEKALKVANLQIGQIDAFAATSGPGLASSLLIGNTTAKALALATGKPFLAINHLEGHLLSPFMGTASGPSHSGVRPCVALIVSGGHTMLVHVRSGEARDYQLLGKTQDDAAGEAFDKVGKMLGLPYPGGPEIDKLASRGDPGAFDFPRSMLQSRDFTFSFSGLKTAVLYQLPKIEGSLEDRLPDVCASFQQAVVDVLVAKTIAAARACREQLVTISGGVSCNAALRRAFAERCRTENLELLIADPSVCTDNAAMIAYAAAIHFAEGRSSSLESDIDPNLPLMTSSPAS